MQIRQNLAACVRAKFWRSWAVRIPPGGTRSPSALAKMMRLRRLATIVLGEADPPSDPCVGDLGDLPVVQQQALFSTEPGQTAHGCFWRRLQRLDEVYPGSVQNSHALPKMTMRSCGCFTIGLTPDSPTGIIPMGLRTGPGRGGQTLRTNSL